MQCIKCKTDLPDGSIYCCWCGKKQTVQKQKRTKARGNGTGSVYQLANKKWRAIRVLSYETVDGKLKKITRSRSDFTTKKAALEYLPQLSAPSKRAVERITFKRLYDIWLPTHEPDVSKSTINCYKAAFKYYEPLWYMKFDDIGIDDLQECIDECPHGKRTRQNMKALGTLLYKYALPRGYAFDNLNYAEFIKIRACDDVGTREAFTDLEIEQIRKSIGTIPYADYIYSMIYTGFRPHEFLTLDASAYNATEKCFVGGGKTEAGTNRSVTVSPKIQPIVDRLTENKTSGPVFCDPTTGKIIADKHFRESCFYPALAACGIERRLTPYCCRHTFASLMDRVTGTDKQKLELMGHTSDKMLRHYQHVRYEDLRRITDAI